MCGITAIAGENLDTRNYQTSRMLETLKKRGPDGVGETTFDSCWLGHRRLSIIDISLGKQPMTDEHLSITFNGEIYNFQELKKTLENLGHIFKTNSDTEVILKAYKQYGNECPKYLDGMFAFAIWDNNNKTLFFARDRFGKKPLYYAFDHKKIIIGSEIKTILASGKIDNSIDLESLDNYLQLMYIPPWKSIYKNILLLPPAHFGIYKNGNLKVERYWHLNFSPIKISYQDAKDEVKKLLNEAVKKRMLASDVEIGSFLSGGVDSSLITILAKDYLKNPIKTFSLGYGNYINELPFAEEVANKIKSEHYTLQAESDQISELEEVISYFDEPHADNSDFPQHLLSKMTASKVKVALSGDGGDELFMGYGWHTRHFHLSYKAHTFEKLFLDSLSGRMRAYRVYSPLARLLMWGSPFKINNDVYAKEQYRNTNNSIDRLTTFDLTTYLPGQLLTKVDRTSMMHGLEVRSPFLDTKLAEFVINLPENFKADNKQQKIILKDILSEYMPKDFVHRRKQGFGAPTIKWLRGKEMQKYTQDILGKNAMVRNIFLSTPIDFMIKRFYIDNNNADAMRIWILLCLEIWLNKANPKI